MAMLLAGCQLVPAHDDGKRERRWNISQYTSTQSRATFVRVHCEQTLLHRRGRSVHDPYSCSITMHVSYLLVTQEANLWPGPESKPSLLAFETHLVTTTTYTKTTITTTTIIIMTTSRGLT